MATEAGIRRLTPAVDLEVLMQARVIAARERKRLGPHCTIYLSELKQDLLAELEGVAPSVILDYELFEAIWGRIVSRLKAELEAEGFEVFS